MVTLTAPVRRAFSVAIGIIQGLNWRNVIGVKELSVMGAGRLLALARKDLRAGGKGQPVEEKPAHEPWTPRTSLEKVSAITLM